NHETVHCQNIREMMADGDWVVPHYGGRPWLERPPLPFWLTMPLVSALGDHSRVYRLASVLAGLPTVLVAAWMGGLFFGRAAGLLAGCVVATLHEFVRYAVAPEADIFVCALVSLGLGLFVHLEFQRRPDARGSFVGARPWAVLLLFAVLGLGNLVKGLFFTDLHLLVPIALFLLLGPDRWGHIKRYVWLPGWVAFAAVAASWAITAYLRQPDIVALWESDYMGRISGGYMREPWWYYLPHLLLNLAPWTPVAFLGLWLTRQKAWADGRSPERFLWLWALAPLVVLSIPRGKHHHYLLSICAPWAVLASVGLLQLRGWLLEQRWLRHPYVALGGLIVALEAAAVVVGNAVPRVGPWVPALLVAIPAFLVVGWMAAVQRDALVGFGLTLALVVAAFWGKEVVDGQSAGPRGDLAFVAAVNRLVPAGRPVLVLDGWGPLDPSWSLYYFHGRARLLHNATFLRAVGGEAYVVTRVRQAGELPAFGTAEHLLTSEVSRNERSPADRLTLYKVTRPDAVARHAGRVTISPMQATGRAEGPYLQ
ncbi:MAG: ArnT family glycosyltransferase, partial [Gemmataceae bacterium]